MDGAEFGCLTSHTALLVKARVARAGCAPPPDEYAFQFSIVQVFTVGARRLDNEGRVNIRSPRRMQFSEATGSPPSLATRSKLGYAFWSHRHVQPMGESKVEAALRAQFKT
jgi:hypothetical protein